MKTLKQILTANPKVNASLLQESMNLSKKLSKAGIRVKRGYSLPSPFDQKMTKTTMAELIASREV